MKTERTDNQQSIDKIIHQASVVKVSPETDTATVRIRDAADCEACAAASLCSVSGKRGSMDLDVAIPSGLHPHVGNRVEIAGTEKLHQKAIRLATVYPTLAILAVMTAIYLLTANQLAAALSGLAVMIIFFSVLWICRHRLAHEFSFSISGIIQD